MAHHSVLHMSTTRTINQVVKLALSLIIFISVQVEGDINNTGQAHLAVNVVRLL